MGSFWKLLWGIWNPILLVSTLRLYRCLYATSRLTWYRQFIREYWALTVPPRKPSSTPRMIHYIWIWAMRTASGLHQARNFHLVIPAKILKKLRNWPFLDRELLSQNSNLHRWDAIFNLANAQKTHSFWLDWALRKFPGSEGWPQSSNGMVLMKMIWLSWASITSKKPRSSITLSKLWELIPLHTNPFLGLPHFLGLRTWGYPRTW